jgi:hypothetical protein
MAKCETCGNDYDRPLEITLDGQRHLFDSFECAIHALAPTCEHCSCRIIGHGLQDGDRWFCCAHCARERGATGLADRS